MVGSMKVNLLAQSFSQAEGNIGATRYDFVFQPTGDFNDSDGFLYEVTGSGSHAANNADFVGGTFPTGTVSTWGRLFAVGSAPGVPGAVVSVMVAGDTDVESDETFALNVYAEPGGKQFTPLTVTAIIQADDPIIGVSVSNGTTGEFINASPAFYNGPVAEVEKEFVTSTVQNINVNLTSDSWFVRTGAGMDAIQAYDGSNVLDGGAGSNFLTGGVGIDAFFIDARDLIGPIWSTVSNLGSGEGTTLWGIDESRFAVTWLENLGATGFKGLTLQATGQGPTTAAVTFAGYTSADLANGKLVVTFGNEPVSGSNYMYVYAK